MVFFFFFLRTGGANGGVVAGHEPVRGRLGGVVQVGDEGEGLRVDGREAKGRAPYMHVEHGQGAWNSAILIFCARDGFVP